MAEKLTACRGILARAVLLLRSNELTLMAWEIHRILERKKPRVEEIVQEYLDASGEHLVEISKAILIGTESDAVKFMVAVALGRSEDPAALPILKGLMDGNPGPAVFASTICAIGLIKSPESTAILAAAFEQLRSTGGPTGQHILVALGLRGPDGLALILEHFKAGDKVAHQGEPWSFRFSRADAIALVRGGGAFEALKGLFDSSSEVELREGAARGMAYNLSEGTLGNFAAIVSTVDDPLKSYMLRAFLDAGPSSSVRTALADRLLTELQFPSGHRALDESLLRIAAQASRKYADAFVEKYLSQPTPTSDPSLPFHVGYLLGMVSDLPDAEARIENRLKALGFDEEMRGVALTVGLFGAPPERAAQFVPPILKMIRESSPSSTRFSNGLQALLFCGIDEKTLSSVLQDSYDRLGDPNERRVMLQELVRYTGNSANKTRVPSIPQTFLKAAVARTSEPETLLCAAYSLMPVSGSAYFDLKPRMAEWIDRDMKWTEFAEGPSFLPYVAPAVVGDYYGRFGSNDDIGWLRDLPESFPYPGTWDDSTRNRVKTALALETRRAIDAIRLRN